MGFLQNLFASNQKVVWKEFADEIGASIIDGGFLKEEKMLAKFEDWEITIDTYMQSTGKSSTVYTRIRAPYKCKDEFNFKIYNKSLFSGINKAFGMQDIEVGYPEFDEKFIIKGNDEVKLNELLSNDKIRELLSFHNNISFEVKKSGGMFGSRSLEDVNQLHFEIVGVIRDVERLRNIYMLFSLVLNKLWLMGLISDEDPEVSLK